MNVKFFKGIGAYLKHKNEDIEKCVGLKNGKNVFVVYNETFLMVIILINTC